MKFIKFLSLVLILFILSGCNNSNLEKISYKEYKELIKNKETFILEVMSSECSACVTLKPRLEEVASEHNLKIKYIDTLKLNEKELNEFNSEVNVDGTPTIIFYENGVEESMATRLVGAASKNKIISKLKDMNYIK